MVSPPRMLTSTGHKLLLFERLGNQADVRLNGALLQRLGTPGEIGSVVAWLAGEDSGFTTGADFSCNGGLHMG